MYAKFMAPLIVLGITIGPVYATSDEVIEAKKIIGSAPEMVSKYSDLSPVSYEFSSRFDANSSVSYTGQAFRQVLMHELSSYIESLGKGAYPGTSDDAYAALNSYYSYSYDAELTAPGSINGFTGFAMTSKNTLEESMPIAEGSIYDDIQEEGKQLRNKTAGNDNPLRRGELKGWSDGDLYGVSLSSVDADQTGDDFIEPEDFIQAILTVIARQAVDGQPLIVGNERISEASVMPDGVHLGELLEKFMMGAISFSQAAEDYLNVDADPGKGLSASNDELAKAGVNYTALEHHWDEGFGYFGAARDYLSYPVEAIAAKQSIDQNQDGQISLLSEKNYGAAVYAAKRKLGASNEINAELLDFTNLSMSYFLKGRHLISAGNPEYIPYVKAYATLALDQWERLLAASSIHYINAYLAELNAYESESYRFFELSKLWSEAKGFALSFQFNPNSSMSDSDFDSLHELMGQRPAVPGKDAKSDVDAYAKKLIEARLILTNSFSFENFNVSAW